jgi:hypothetical protein
MHRIKILLLLLMPGQLLLAQKASSTATVKANPYAGTDVRAMQIPDSLTTSTAGIAGYISTHFDGPVEKTRAVFIWVSGHIQYDVANMFAMNFYETNEGLITKALKTRKGICANYAAVFTDICVKAGIPSYVVDGYTKQKGFVDYIPHAWCVAKVDSGWYCFDPTWGSGYINNGKFVSSINNEYFRARPEAFVKTHVPFDYLWECLYYPVTNQEFYEGKTTPNPSKPRFNYPDSIKAYAALSPVQQDIAAAARVEASGLRNSMVFDRLQHLKLRIENYRRQEEVDRQNADVERRNGVVKIYNAALADYNESVRQFNVYINYYNAQFKPERTDAEIQGMIDSCDSHIRDARAKLDGVTTDDAQIKSAVGSLNKDIDEIAGRVAEQQDWLKKYFSKGKMGRRSMFRKITWFGIPLN